MALAQSPAQTIDARREEIVRTDFEPQLARLGLAVEQIENQDLDELNDSLAKVNDGIAHPESFGVFKVETGTLVTKVEYEIGILPVLLERKGLILARIKTLAGERRIESLKDLP